MPFADVVETASVPGYGQFAETSCAVCGAPRDRNVYVRWGRSVCPTGATPLNVGWMAGSKYNDAGGGSDYLCMAAEENPIEPTLILDSNGANLWV